MRKTVSGALSVLKMFKTALHGEKVVHIYWHTSAFSLRLRLSHAMHAITSSVMNTSEDTSTISCNAFSPARSTLDENKIKSMTNNDVWDNLDLQKLILVHRFFCPDLQRLLLSSAGHLYLTHGRSFDNATYNKLKSSSLKQETVQTIYYTFLWPTGTELSSFCAFVGIFCWDASNICHKVK